MDVRDWDDSIGPSRGWWRRWRPATPWRRSGCGRRLPWNAWRTIPWGRSLLGATGEAWKWWAVGRERPDGGSPGASQPERRGDWPAGCWGLASLNSPGHERPVLVFGELVGCDRQGGGGDLREVASRGAPGAHPAPPRAARPVRLSALASPGAEREHDAVEGAPGGDEGRGPGVEGDLVR